MGLAKEAANATGTRLSAGLQLLLLLMRLRFGLSQAADELLRAHLSPEVDDSSPEQGWEERTDCAVMALLRTALAKGSGGDTAFAPSTLKPLTDTSKLKKHIHLVAERLAKGVALQVTKE